MKYGVGWTHSRRILVVCFLEIVPDVNFSNKLYSTLKEMKTQ